MTTDVWLRSKSARLPVRVDHTHFGARGQTVEVQYCKWMAALPYLHQSKGRQKQGVADLVRRSSVQKFTFMFLQDTVSCPVAHVLERVGQAS